jgi:4-hydroxy-3-methylbut-2-en-1-yl diphosphate synthase IspG/GcpE
LARELSDISDYLSDFWPCHYIRIAFVPSDHLKYLRINPGKIETKSNMTSLFELQSKNPA